MQKANVLFVTDYKGARLPVQLAHQITRLHVENQATFDVPKQRYDVIMLYNGSMPLNTQLLNYVIAQHQMGVPIILFPYMALQSSSFNSPLIQPMHPLEFGTQQGCGSNNSFIAVCKHHAILQQVSTFSCSSVHRQLSNAKKDTIVIATWADDIPLIAERNNVVALNFCLTHFDLNSDASMMIANTITYLVNKNRRKMFKQVPKAYCDIIFT